MIWNGPSGNKSNVGLNVKPSIKLEIRVSGQFRLLIIFSFQVSTNGLWPCPFASGLCPCLQSKFSIYLVSGCSTAVEHMPHNREIMVLIPVRFWAFLSFYPQLCVLELLPQWGAALLFFLLKLAVQLGQNKQFGILNKYK